jgi:hypothetical protein
MDRPIIVCLCGSTRFKKEFEMINKQLTLCGKIVLSVGCFPHTDDKGSPEDVLGENVKYNLDQLHLKKVELADEVYIINVNGYIGNSTKRELNHAIALNKQISYFTDEYPDYTL